MVHLLSPMFHCPCMEGHWSRQIPINQGPRTYNYYQAPPRQFNNLSRTKKWTNCKKGSWVVDIYFWPYMLTQVFYYSRPIFNSTKTAKKLSFVIPSIGHEPSHTEVSAHTTWPVSRNVGSWCMGVSTKNKGENPKNGWFISWKTPIF